MSDGNCQEPTAKLAMPPTVAMAEAAGPAAAGPMRGARKPKTPAKAAFASARICSIMPPALAARLDAAPADSADVRAATPVVTAAVFATSPVCVVVTCVATPAAQSATMRMRA